MSTYNLDPTTKADLQIRNYKCSLRKSRCGKAASLLTTMTVVPGYLRSVVDISKQVALVHCP